LGKSATHERGTKASVNDGVVDRARAMKDGAEGDGSSVRMLLQAMLKEATNHLMSEQQKMLQKLWSAWQENKKALKKVMSDQLEMIRLL
jgi:gas vesicle protein